MRIARQHEKDPWRPLLAWPEDCYVQWGGAGLVVHDEPGKSYQTAFFEAFPSKRDDAGGFIRGEGDTVEAAEGHAFSLFQRQYGCEHRWRRRYLAGGGDCVRCGAFAVVFKPVVQLGKWREPADLSDIVHVVDGYANPRSWDEVRTRHRRRRMWLKVRALGIDVPEPIASDEIHPPEEWTRRARSAVRGWLMEQGGIPTDTGTKKDLLFGIQGVMAVRRLRRILEEKHD